MTNLDIERLPEFDNHKLVTFVYSPEENLKGFIAIHRGGNNTPALGATRLWAYSNENEALRDALRLSRLMSYKSAMAGLRYGGAKATLIETPEVLKNRDKFFRAYAKRVNDLKGQFITGTDVGVYDEDVKIMKQETPYVIGSQVDPAHYTAIGVVRGIKAALKKLFGNEKITGRTFAIQGVGKTGSRILEILYPEAALIIIADIDPAKTKDMKKRFPKLRVVGSEEIHSSNADVFVPCALSGVLNSQTTAQLHCKIVAGSANNQLSGNHIADLLFKLGIVYAPDYIINAGGLISVADEFEHSAPNDKRIIKRIEKIYKNLKAVFDKSEKQKISTSAVADRMAEKIFNSH